MSSAGCHRIEPASQANRTERLEATVIEVPFKTHHRGWLRPAGLDSITARSGRALSRPARPGDRRLRMSGDPKLILILGGGFAGVYTARYLETSMNRGMSPPRQGRRAKHRSCHVCRRQMLPDIISGSIGLTNVVSPIRRLCPRTNLIMREVRDINLKDQIVTISPASVHATSNSNTITWSSRSGVSPAFTVCSA